MNGLHNGIEKRSSKGKQIMLRRKPFVEEHQRQAEGQLKARLQLLKSKGMDDKTILKDAKVKQLRALERKAKRQLVNIAAMQTLAETKKAAKAQKTATAKALHQKPTTSARSAVPKKPKKERKSVPEEQ